MPGTEKRERRSSRPTRPAKSTKPGRPKAQETAPAQPRFRAYLAVSFDGYIADVEGGVGWLDPYFTPEIDFQAFFGTIGAMVMGRATWDWTVAHQNPVRTAGRCIVQTHRPLENAPEGVEAFAGDVRELAAELRRELAGTGKDVCLFGGGESIASFDEHGLVDRWELAIIPVLLGDGIPLFPRRARSVQPLRLVRSRALENGTVLVEYEPARAPSAGC